MLSQIQLKIFTDFNSNSWKHVKKLHKFLEIFDSPCCEFEEEDVIEAAKEAFNKVTNSWSSEQSKLFSLEMFFGGDGKE